MLKPTPLPRRFYLRKTDVVAREMLGQILVVRIGRRVRYCRIVETEAYLGLIDPSAHSYGDRRTPRTASMYLSGGHSYVYFIYGMYFCLNASTGPEGRPEAVLIRAVEVMDGDHPRAGAGPGKLCRFLGITREMDGLDLCDSSSPLWIGGGARVSKKDVVVAKRVGLSHAEAKHWPLRFYVRGSAAISKK